MPTRPDVYTDPTASTFSLHKRTLFADINKSSLPTLPVASQTHTHMAHLSEVKLISVEDP